MSVSDREACLDHIMLLKYRINPTLNAATWTQDMLHMSTRRMLTSVEQLPVQGLSGWRPYMFTRFLNDLFSVISDNYIGIFKLAADSWQLHFRNPDIELLVNTDRTGVLVLSRGDDTPYYWN